MGINYASVPQRNIAKEISDGGFGLNFSEPDKKMAMASSWEGIFEQCSMDSLNSLHLSTQPVGMIGQVYVNEVGLKEANIEDLCNQPEWQVLSYLLSLINCDGFPLVSSNVLFVLLFLLQQRLVIWCYKLVRGI